MSTAHKKSDPTTRRIQGYQMETETNPGIYACAVCPNFKPTAEIRGYKEHMRYILTLILDLSGCSMNKEKSMKCLVLHIILRFRN